MRDYLIVVIELIAKILAGIMILIYGFALVSLLEGGQKPDNDNFKKAAPNINLLSVSV
jgi:hypothetical protein